MSWKPIFHFLWRKKYASRCPLEKVGKKALRKFRRGWIIYEKKTKASIVFPYVARNCLSVDDCGPHDTFNFTLRIFLSLQSRSRIIRQKCVERFDKMRLWKRKLYVPIDKKSSALFFVIYFYKILPKWLTL